MRSRTPTRKARDLGQHADAWFSPARFAVFLVVLVVAAFPDVVSGLRSFAFRDFAVFGHPLAAYHRECFWQQTVPLWNPWNNCGIPFLAQWNTLTLYPPSLVYLLLPLPWSLDLFCLAHLYLSGLGMYFLAWQLTSHRLAAAFAGVVFAFNGLLLNSLIWPNNIAALGWMPWVVYATGFAGTEGGRRLRGAAIFGSLQMLSGGPEIILLTWLIALTRCLVPVTDPGVSLAARLRRFTVVVLWVAGLAAAQLAPFVDLLAHSQRQTGYTGASWAMTAWGWVNLLVPLFRCFEVSGGVFLQSGQVWTSSYYVGVFTLVLAAWGLARGRNGPAWLLAAVFGIGMVLALGEAGHLYPWLRSVVPEIGVMRYPIKFVVLSVFAAPLLGAWGLARWRRLPSGGEKNARVSLGVAFGLFAILLAAILTYVRFSPPYPNTANWAALWPNTLLRAVWLALMAVILFSLMRWTSPLLRLALLLLVWLDLVSHVPRQNPTIDPTLLKPEWVRARPDELPLPGLGQGRVALHPDIKKDFGRVVFPDPAQQYNWVRTAWDGSANLLDHVPKWDGMFSLHLREMDRFQLGLQKSFDALPNLVAGLGISHVGMLGRGIEWVPRPGSLPWVTLGQTPEFVDDETALRNVLSPGFAPRERVYLPRAAQAAGVTTDGGDGEILGSRFHAERVELEVKARVPSWLVVAQAYFHPWQAAVDEGPNPLWRANHGCQATLIPAGIHKVVFRYVDRSFQLGLSISVLTLAMTLAWGFRRGPADTRDSGPCPAVSGRAGTVAQPRAVHRNSRTGSRRGRQC